MRKCIVTLVVVLSCGVSALADYPADRKVAMDLVNAGKNQEALAAFLKMAEETQLDAQKTDALNEAAMCAFRLKNVDQAMKLAEKIPQPQMSKAVQMRLMLWDRKFEELVAKYKDENFDGWPEKAAGEAAYARGRAYMIVRDGKAAEADLKKAVEFLGDGEVRNEARLNLAETYRDLLKDDARALATYNESIAMTPKHGWINMSSVTSASGILARQKKFDEALAMLKQYEADKMTGVWKYNFMLAYADLDIAQGKKAEAVARLNGGLASKDIAEWQKAEFESRLKSLQSEAK